MTQGDYVIVQPNVGKAYRVGIVARVVNATAEYATLEVPVMDSNGRLQRRIEPLKCCKPAKPFQARECSRRFRLIGVTA